MTSVTWHVSYLSHIIFVVISIYSVQLRDKTIDRLTDTFYSIIYVQPVLPLARHFKQYYNSISTIYTYVIRRLTNGITVMCITDGFMVGLGSNGFTNPVISSCLEISSAYNQFSSRFSFPIAIHRCNVYRVYGLHNISPLLPPGNHAHVQNTWHLLE